MFYVDLFCSFFIFLLFLWEWSGTESTITEAASAPDDDDDDADKCGAICGMIVRGNRSAQRCPVPVPICPPQIALDLARARTRDAVEVSRRLTA
jgi:hypothetical protein